MIDKPSILITSIGRTGTEFFARFFADIIPASTSLHEPDIFQYTGVEHRLAHYLKQVRRAGIWRMGALKVLGKWTLANVSDARFLGRINDAQAIHSLDDQRRVFIDRMPGSVYVEANIGYYGLLDIIPKCFTCHRAIYIVRDGRDWVRSHMNWGELYGKKGVRKLISHNWPTAAELPDDPHAEEWQGFSRFERLCWAWSRLNEYALAVLPLNAHARLYRFEEIFSGEERYRILDELVNFTTSLPSLSSVGHGSTAGWLEKQVHQSSGGFPAWGGWTKDQKRQFIRHCAPLMERLGYTI